MEYEGYFAPVLEFGRLVRLYKEAAEGKKQEIARRLIGSEYLKELRKEQTIVELDVLKQMAGNRVNSSLHPFFVNMAVPSEQKEEPQEIRPYHRHSYLELIYVYRGRYIQYINGIRHELKAGEFYLLNPNVVHRDAISGREDVVFFFGMSESYVQNDLSAAFAPHPELKEFMEYQLGRSTRQYILFRPGNREAVEEVLQSIIREHFEKLPGHHSVIHGMLVRLFSILVRKDSYRVCCRNIAEDSDYMVAEIVRYIKAHLAESSRKEIAAYFHFNPDYLNRLFVKTLGICYLEYVRDLKLDRAAELLTDTDRSVQKILRELGVSNRSYFDRIFLKRYGMLPAQYRKENGN